MQVPNRLFVVCHAVLYVNWQQASVTGSKVYKAVQIAGKSNAVLAYLLYTELMPTASIPVLVLLLGVSNLIFRASYCAFSWAFLT